MAKHQELSLEETVAQLWQDYEVSEVLHTLAHHIATYNDPNNAVKDKVAQSEIIALAAYKVAAFE